MRVALRGCDNLGRAQVAEMHRCTPSRTRTALALAAAAAVALPAQRAAAQVISGTVLDSVSETPVVAAGVFLLDRQRDKLAVVVTDEEGLYRMEVPGAGEYLLFIQRIGYLDTESPLFHVGQNRVYSLDFDLKQEPIPLDPISVVVNNDAMESWLRRELGVNPNSVFGFRSYQGQRLQEIKALSRDNTEMLRRLFVPVRHGREVCLGYGMPSIERGSPSMTNWSVMRITAADCGKLFVDDMLVPTEHIDSFDHRRVAVVVLLPPNVHLYTFGFKWSF